MFTPNIVPGQGFIPFEIFTKKGGLTGTGRAVPSQYEPTTQSFLGMLTNANQKEVERWSKNDHPITHKVTSYGAMVKAKATDDIKSKDGRCFYVQGVKNPGNLDVTMIYYVEERADMK